MGVCTQDFGCTCIPQIVTTSLERNCAANMTVLRTNKVSVILLPSLPKSLGIIELVLAPRACILQMQHGGYYPESATLLLGLSNVFADLRALLRFPTPTAYAVPAAAAQPKRITPGRENKGCKGSRTPRAPSIEPRLGNPIPDCG